MSSSHHVIARRILGVRVDDVTYADTLDACRTALVARQPRQIVTLNTEMLMIARRDWHLASIVEHAYLVTPDGVGLLLAGRLLGQKLREQVTGTDLLPRLARLAAEEGWRLFLLGARPGVAALAARNLSEQFPRLQVAGTHAGSPTEPLEGEITALVRATHPDVLLVAFGVPAEEKWIARNLERLEVPLVIGVGGAFDFTAGAVPRAPLWMRQRGLEWLYRLGRQPWRWRRMLALPRFLGLVLAEAAASRVRLRR